MKKPWSDLLITVLVAASGVILEVIKILKKKGKVPS